MDDIHLIILAAGKGKRMNSELPKVLLPLADKPLLLHLLDAVSAAGIAAPVIVVGVGSEQVRAAAGDRYRYVEQTEQLGTGHAVSMAESELAGRAEHVMVLYGDHPLVDADTIRRITAAHREGGAPLTMATVRVDDFDDWRGAFADYGRIVRKPDGSVERIVERKDAAANELLITEVNPSYFCFKASWLWENLKRLDNRNAQGEYYLTALPGLARDAGFPIHTVPIDPITALGANTPEQLAVLERMLAQRSGA